MSNNSPEGLTVPINEAEAKNFTAIIATYNYPEIGLRAEVVAPKDYRVEQAKEIEIAAMVAIGDPEDEVREEFDDYDNSSIFFLAFKEGSQGKPDDIQAMGRMIPHQPELGNKSLTDLADMVGWEYAGIATRSDVDINGQPIKVHERQSVIEAFQRESGCEDISKIWDIATMAPNLDKWEEWKTDGIKAGRISKAVINAFTQESVCAWQRGEITHLTSINQTAAHDYFVKLGFPFKPMFNLPPLKYDNNGTGEGMEAQPAWLSVADLADKVAQREGRYFGELALEACTEVSVVEQIDS